MVRKMYHTQERRNVKLKGPVKCVKDNAWLGEAWYFWYDKMDAVHWGISSKKRRGYYEIYDADLNCQNLLDTVFNEEQYIIWINAIQAVEKRYLKKGIHPTLKILNDFFYDQKIWSKFDGILFQDISSNNEDYFTKGFQYKKRIQLAVFNDAIISNFALKEVGECV